MKQTKKFLKLNTTQLCSFTLHGFTSSMPIKSGKVNVYITTNKFKSYNINIYWDQPPLSFKNYKQHGLFGFYSTDFSQPTYDQVKNELTLTDSNEKIIILTY